MPKMVAYCIKYSSMKFYWAFILLNIGTIVSAQQAPFKLPVMPEGNNNTLLWEVTGNGLQSPSYFLGTMHILCPDDAYLSKGVLSILDMVNEVYFEIDLDNMALMMGAMTKMAMRNDTVLSDLLEPEDYKAVETYFSNKLPLPFSLMKRLKPMLLAGMLSEQMLPCKAGSGTEMLLSEEAKKRSLPTGGLETPAYQFGLFDSIPYQVQAEELLKVIKDTAGEGSEVTGKMLEAFQKQDLNALEQLTISEEGGMAGYLDLLIFQRNRNWVKRFAEIASQKPALFAVGAGHLPGDNGVLKLLEKAGYTLRPLVNQKPAANP